MYQFLIYHFYGDFFHVKNPTNQSILFGGVGDQRSLKSNWTRAFFDLHFEFLCIELGREKNFQLPDKLISLSFVAAFNLPVSHR